MEAEYKKILEKQLQLLSERTRSIVETGFRINEVPELTKQMIDIIQLLCPELQNQFAAAPCSETKSTNPIKAALNDTIKNLWRSSKYSVFCWKDKDGESHYLSSCTSEELVDLLAHLIFSHSKNSYNWQSTGVIFALRDKVEEMQTFADALAKKV